MTWLVTLDGEPVANLRPGETVTLDLPPGPRFVGVNCRGGAVAATDAQGQAQVALAAGHTYRFRASIVSAAVCQIALSGVS